MSSTVMTRNNQAGPTVFRDKAKDILVEYQGKGDPAGNDIQEVPESVLNHPQFSKALKRGIITVLNDAQGAEADDAIARQQEAFAAAEEAVQETISESIARETDRDLLAHGCVGPNSKGQGPCNQPVPVPVQEQGERPPLCPQHTHLSSEFVLYHTEELDDDGKSVTRWVRATLGEREGGSGN